MIEWAMAQNPGKLDIRFLDQSYNSLRQRPQNSHPVSKSVMNRVVFRLLRSCHHIACCENVYLTQTMPLFCLWDAYLFFGSASSAFCAQVISS
jgi:hypothetical protein